MSSVSSRNAISLAVVTSSLVALTILTVQPNLSAHADPLSEVIESKAFKRIDRPQHGKSGLYTSKWFTPGSSFEAVFVDPKGGSLLLDWLGVGSLGLTLGALESHRVLEYVMASRVLLTEDLGRIEISARVPHPKFRDTIEMGLIDAFVNLEPPKLKILYSKQIAVGEESAMYYEHEDGACSVVLKGSRGSLINIFTPSPKHCEVLGDIANKLDLTRFNERLNA